MGRFDPEANVSRFARMLYNETDPAKRARLRQLLVDEENRFAWRSLQLEMVDRHIAEACARIDEQTNKILELHTGGNDTDEMYRALANSISILEVFRAFRTSLSDSIDRSEL